MCERSQSGGLNRRPRLPSRHYAPEKLPLAHENTAKAAKEERK